MRAATVQTSPGYSIRSASTGAWIILEEGKTPSRWVRFWTYLLLGWRWRPFK